MVILLSKFTSFVAVKVTLEEVLEIDFLLEGEI
jgi:hypothetical protein